MMDFVGMNKIIRNGHSGMLAMTIGTGSITTVILVPPAKKFIQKNLIANVIESNGNDTKNNKPRNAAKKNGPEK